MSEMIERVARAIYVATPRNKPYSLLTRFKRNALEAEARAAIEAIREPTEAMLDAIYVSEQYYIGVPAWRAAIDAALSEKP